MISTERSRVEDDNEGCFNFCKVISIIALSEPTMIHQILNKHMLVNGHAP